MDIIQHEIIELAHHLRQERLFVSSERQHLQHLNEKVLKSAEHVYHLAWIAGQQRANLDGLILGRSESSPNSNTCCQRAANLESVTFTDGYKHLGIHESLYGEFLQTLRENPKILALCLSTGDKVGVEGVQWAVNIVLGSLYGYCIMPEDELLVMHLLRQLMKLQLAKTENPRRLLRKGNCAFSRLYKSFSECLFASKLFLTAALHEPILQLLTDDEMYLDVDPAKGISRLSPEEQMKRLGSSATPEYAQRVEQYQQWMMDKLVTLTGRFINSLQQTIQCFPSNLAWLVRQMAQVLLSGGQMPESEVHAMCTDLVFSLFICPAIVNPEPYGITDVPIGAIARFNLIQVAQILQVLALAQYKDIENKGAIYIRFDKVCMSDMITSFLMSNMEEEPPGADIHSPTKLTRSAALIAETDLHQLVCFLRNAQREMEESIVEKKALSALLSSVPTAMPPQSPRAILLNGNGIAADPHKISPPDTPKRGLLSKVNRNRNRGSSANQEAMDDEPKRQSSEDSGSSNGSTDTVLVIAFPSAKTECVGMMSENKVLSLLHQGRNRVRMNLGNLHPPDEVDGVGGTETTEKRTRFSLSHDEGSIGNTSDNLEAVSEAASNHSVASSLDSENEDQNADNLSDMVSANVSGRGTPNVSGRDTPSSQVTEGEEPAAPRPVERRNHLPLDNLPANQCNHPKQSRTDIEDKFGKFEIRAMIEGDETVSLVSDTWSTDVLASDSEFLDHLERTSRPASDVLAPARQLSDGGTGNLLDISETASEAWSMDVMPSDSDRMGEVDTDDTSSVARSDDTARSELEVEVPSLDALSGDITSDDTLHRVGFRPIREEGMLPPPSTNHIRGLPPPPLRMTIGDTAHNHPPPPSPERRVYHPSERSSLDEVDSCLSGGSSRRDSSTSLPRLVAFSDSLPPDSPRSIESFPKQSHHLTTLRPVPISVPVPISSGSLPTLHTSSHESLGGTHPCTPQPVRSGSEEYSGPPPVSPVATSFVKQQSRRRCSQGAERQVENNSDGNIIKLNLGGVETALPVANGPTKILTNHVNKAPPQNSDTKFNLSESCDMDVTSSTPSNNTSTARSDQDSSKSSLPGGPSTGAIPKSISFDKSAERGDMDGMDDDNKHRRGFFRNFKISFKGRSRKLLRSQQDEGGRGSKSGHYGNMSWGVDSYRTDLFDGAQLRFRKSFSDDNQGNNNETSDDILAKYRCKPTNGGGDTTPPNNNSNIPQAENNQQQTNNKDDEDQNIVDETYAFHDAKRKLRIVLSTADVQGMFGLVGTNNPLISFLRLQLAEAINLQDRSLVAQLHETLRCVSLFCVEDCLKLFRSIKEDYQKRTTYIAYLTRCRQGLLNTLGHLERMTERLEQDRQVCGTFLVALCVRLFLEKREGLLHNLVGDFQQLTAADEKTDLVERYLRDLSHELTQDPIWQGASVQLQVAQSVVEQAVMSHMYIYAMYPNGDGDVSRDQVLHNHMVKLSNVITVNHKDMKIPKLYHFECPWPSAQAEIVAINAYKLPRDKLQCVMRCSATITNLLSMASEKEVPAADDIIPVLVFVLIKANPPSLLSTIQYVNNFYVSRSTGEEQYWWTQFCAAVEFIKTMDYVE